MANSTERVSDTEIIEKLRGKPNGTKVQITFLEKAVDGGTFTAMGFLIGMKDNIITMDRLTFINLYAVATSGKWDQVSRTFEVTLDLNEESDLENWFAPRLGYGVEKIEVI